MPINRVRAKKTYDTSSGAAAPIDAQIENTEKKGKQPRSVVDHPSYLSLQDPRQAEDESDVDAQL